MERDLRRRHVRRRYAHVPSAFAPLQTAGERSASKSVAVVNTCRLAYVDHETLESDSSPTGAGRGAGDWRWRFDAAQRLERTYHTDRDGSDAGAKRPPPGDSGECPQRAQPRHAVRSESSGSDGALRGSLRTVSRERRQRRYPVRQRLYPKPPDLRLAETQKLSDGELFWIVENGIRFTGMPAFGGSHGSQDDWKLVLFIRHLPQLTMEERVEMERDNPKGPPEHEKDHH